MFHIAVSRDELTRLQKIIHRLDAQPLSAAADRRELPRCDFAHPLWLNLPAETGKPWIHIFSRNLSTGGLAFLSRKIFYLDQHLVISHALKEKQQQLVLARVCYCRSVELGIHEVGLSFIVNHPDPENQRRIPIPWLALVLQNDWLARRKFPVGTLA